MNTPKECKLFDKRFEIIFNTLNVFAQHKRGPLLKDKTNQIPRDFYTILTTHNAFLFTM